MAGSQLAFKLTTHAPDQFEQSDNEPRTVFDQLALHCTSIAEGLPGTLCRLCGIESILQNQTTYIEHFLNITIIQNS